ncbi:hypothetical protein Goarm_017328 [Gossypium armourianum]|uniref:RNase H type-1 domain-containing protein n=1 Tax=Gossypium armourianum TaxID=34283 RepID=A0A7J9JGK4_9ROSI|nr:hypothetical protein [Gossypium armourianum]
MLRESDSDQISWQWLSAGKFSLAKSYKHLLNTSGQRQFGYDIDSLLRTMWLVRGNDNSRGMVDIFQIEARDILEGLKLAWMRERQFKLQHVLKESNKVADCIANVAGSEMNQLVVFVDPTSHLRKFLEENIDNSMQITSSGL